MYLVCEWASEAMLTSIFSAFQNKLLQCILFEIQSQRPFSSLFPLYKTTEIGFQTRKNFKQQNRWQWQNPDNSHVQQIIFLVQQEKLTGRFLAKTMKFDLHWISPLFFCLHLKHGVRAHHFQIKTEFLVCYLSYLRCFEQTSGFCS